MPYGYQELLEELGIESGGDEEVDFLAGEVSDSICEGICKVCGNLQTCEPDADNNYCDSCENPTVVSSLCLKGLM